MHMLENRLKAAEEELKTAGERLNTAAFEENDNLKDQSKSMRYK